MGRLGSFLIGALIGGVVGSVSALLLTPDSGEQIRQQMGEMKDNLVEQVRSARMQKRLEMELELNRLKSGQRSEGLTIQ